MWGKYKYILEGEYAEVPIEKHVMHLLPPTRPDIIPYPDTTRGSIREYKWGIREGLREIFQNMLDEMEEVTGEPIFYYRQDEYGTWIWDYGRGVLPEHWFGRPGKPEEAERIKPEWARGRYGQGMKYGSVAIIDQGMVDRGRDYIIYMWSKALGGTAYVIYLDYFTFMGRSVECLHVAGFTGATVPINNAGTVILISGYRGPLYLDQLALKWARPDIEILFSAKWEKTWGVPPEKPSSIIKEKEKRIYCRNILVGTEEITGKKLLFSYDLWWVGLNPARDNVDMWDFKTQQAKLYERCTSKEVWRKWLMNISSTEYVETTNDYYYRLEDEAEKVLREVIKELYPGQVIVALTGMQALSAEMLRRLGYTPIIVDNSNIVRILKQAGALTLDDIEEEERKKGKLYREIRDEELHEHALGRLNAARVLGKIIERRVMAEKKSAKKLTIKAAEIPRLPNRPRAYGSYDAETGIIYLDYYHLLYGEYVRYYNTILHELGHYVDYELLGRTDEPPSDDAMEIVHKEVFDKLLTDDKVRNELYANAVYLRTRYRPIPRRVDYETDLYPLEATELVRTMRVEAMSNVERIREYVNVLNVIVVPIIRDINGYVVWTEIVDIDNYHKFTEYVYGGYIEAKIRDIKGWIEYKAPEEVKFLEKAQLYIYDPWYDKYVVYEEFII